MPILPTITNTFKLLRWETGERPSEGNYADDGWWLVTVDGHPGTSRAVYDGKVR